MYILLCREQSVCGSCSACRLSLECWDQESKGISTCLLQVKKRPLQLLGNLASLMCGVSGLQNKFSLPPPLFLATNFPAALWHLLLKPKFWERHAIHFLQSLLWVAWVKLSPWNNFSLSCRWFLIPVSDWSLPFFETPGISRSHQKSLKGSHVSPPFKSPMPPWYLKLVLSML